ncbi:MAG TPA: hypothetical protein PKN48_00725 [Bacteroidales bacterium]|nr:hypothetical protein [Bacteroidales bacterium]
MGLSVDQILASLESEKTAEDIFATSLVAESAEKTAQEEPEEVPEVETEETPEEDPTEETEVEEPEAEEAEEIEEPEEKEAAAKCAPAPKKKVAVEKKAEEEVTEKVAESDDFQKLAEDLDAQGRIMAHGFFDELVKLSEIEVPEVAEQEEKTAEVEAEDEGTKILMNLYNRYHGGNN